MRQLSPAMKQQVLVSVANLYNLFRWCQDASATKVLAELRGGFVYTVT